jgi:putative hydrolase of the HAD superfamily
MGGGAIDTVFVDVGGTLLPNAFPRTPEQRERRLAALGRLLDVDGRAAGRIVDTVDAELDSAPEATVADVLGRALAAQGFEPGAALVRSARQALCVPLAEALSPFDHAGELLSTLKEMGLGCVILSNTAFRDAELYQLDFQAFGWDRWVDRYLTSVDAGCCKPDERIFRLALEMAGTRPDRCVMIGNSEVADIEPALRLGMRAIRVAIEEPPPMMTAAGACVTGLDEVPDVLQKWDRGP